MLFFLHIWISLFLYSIILIGIIILCLFFIIVFWGTIAIQKNNKNIYLKLQIKKFLIYKIVLNNKEIKNKIEKNFNKQIRNYQMKIKTKQLIKESIKIIKDIIELIKKKQIKITLDELYIVKNIRYENMFLNVYNVSILSSIIPIIIKNYIYKINSEKYFYEIKMNNKNNIENIMKIQISFRILNVVKEITRIVIKKNRLIKSGKDKKRKNILKGEKV